MARVAQNGAVFEHPEVFTAEHAGIAGEGHKDVALAGGFQHRHDPKAVHGSLQSADRVNLGYDHLSAQAARPAGHAFAAPAVAGDHDHFAGQQDIGRPQHAVQGRLSGAVAVVEQLLGGRVVDRNNRQPEHPVVLHGAQANDSGRGLFHAGDQPPELLFVAGIGVQQRHQIGAVVEGHGRRLAQHGVQMLVVGLVVLAPDGIGRNPLTGDQGGGRIVLGRERV